MEGNPYKAPEAGNEPAPAQPRPLRVAAKSGALIGAIIMFGLFAITLAFVLMTSPPLQLHELGDLGYALAAMFGWTIAGSAVGAAFGVLFQAIANAMIRRDSKEDVALEVNGLRALLSLIGRSGRAAPCLKLKHCVALDELKKQAGIGASSVNQILSSRRNSLWSPLKMALSVEPSAQAAAR